LKRFDRGTDAKVDRAHTRASSRSRRTASISRLIVGRPRRSAALLALAMLLGIAGVAIAGPSGALLEGGEQASGGVERFGPINPVNGFPDWYRDTNGEEVEPCISNSDPMCNGPLEVPDVNEDVSFPDNFPEEFFYFTGEASLTANGGNAVLALYTIEGTYGGGDTQTVFGRTRYRIRGGLQAGAEYTITNPYGVDTVVAGDDSTVFVTDDVGVGSRNFGGLFEGQVGPFLKWDSDKPAHYLGDPSVAHTVTGSPFDTNFVKIEGPGVGGANNPNPCPGKTADSSPDCIYTELFSILGKESTTGGVDVARAGYALDAADGARPQLDIMAESKAGQDIVVRDTDAGSDRRFPITPLETEQNRYFARVDVQGELPRQVEVVNRGDIPQTVKRVDVIDTVNGTAFYDTADRKLHVQAESSDETAPLTDLTVQGFKKPLDSDGVVAISTKAPAPTVTVASERGGSVVIPVQVQGPGLAPLALAANAGSDQSVEQDTTVRLDGSASTGNIDSYEWTGPDDIALQGADTAKATFTAPSAEGDYVFTLKVSGPDGEPATATSRTATVTVHVNAVGPAEARIAFGSALIAPDASITVAQNMPVTLDGGQSPGATAFKWSQVGGGPAVALGATDSARLAFTFPKRGTPVTLKLEVRNPEAVRSGQCTQTSCSSAFVTLVPEPDGLAVGRARFVPDGSRWVIDGTASSTGANTVQVYSGLALNPAMLIGTTQVAGGAWSLDVRESTVPTTTCLCVTVVADRGGQVVGFKLEKFDRLPPGTVDPGEPPAPTAAAARAPVAAAVAAPVAGATAPLARAATLVATRLSAPAAVSAAEVGTTGVAVTVQVPAGASLVRLRVLPTAGAALYSTFKKVTRAGKVRLRIRSAGLRRKVRAGRRYILEARAGTSRTRLGKATRKVLRIRR
jgi:K319-like protein